MKVAIVTELFPPSIGGQELRLAEISQELVHRGHSVHVFCILTTPGTRREEVVDNVTVSRHPEAHKYRQPSIAWLRRKPSVVLKYALWCRRIDPDAFDLFIFNQWPLAHICLAPASIRKKSVIDWCEFRQGALFNIIQATFPGLVSGNIANSLTLKSQLEKLSGCHVECIPSGIYVSRYRSVPSAQRSGILSLGRIEEHKNLRLVLSSYESLVAKGYSGRLRIAGTGPAFADLQRLSKTCGCADRVDIMSFISDKEKVELLASSELLLITSRREGFPRVIAEGMASGLPVVTADYPGNGAKDIVRQYGIGRVAVPTPEKIAEESLAVISQWQLYSNACLASSESLDWKVVVDRLLLTAASLNRGYRA